MASDFDPNVPIEYASTPPSAWYRDPAYLEREGVTVFRHQWQFVGRLDQVNEPGAYFTGQLIDEPYVVVRGDDGVLRAFFNVCRHHAAVVADGAGCARELSCPYHGWRYGLDGRLKKAPRLGGAKNFKASDFGLVPMHVTTWGPLVAICPVNATEMQAPRRPQEQWSDLSRQLDKMAWEELVFAERRVYEIDCNWKVYIDNYLDGGYHVSVLHRDLSAGLDLDSYETTLGDRMVLQKVEGVGDARIGRTALYAWLYPGFMINRYGPMMDTNFVVPLSPTRCRVVFDYYFSKATMKDAEFVRDALCASEQVQREDIWISESVQIGLTSSAYDKGRYAPGVERGEHLFHSLLAHDYEIA